MQAMTTLRPQRVGLLLRHCRSIKAKRLFLALAERHRHAWLSHVSLEGVDLGRGKRALVPGGRLHPSYQITLPGDLDEHLALTMGPALHGPRAVAGRDPAGVGFGAGLCA